MAIPAPEPGLVINYAYLWHRQREAGAEEGSKNRPCVIVLAVTRGGDDATIVTVLPITHTAPSDPSAALEIPVAVKRHLGLDEWQSWVVLDEGNEFVWPGFDLRKRPRSDLFDFGFLPPRFFAQIQAGFADCHRIGRARFVSRE